MSRRSPVLNGKGPSKHRPDRFGPFHVRADLGAGRFGPVYLGRDPSANTRVVIRTFELSREAREFGKPSDLVDSLRKLCETTVDHEGLARPLAFGNEGNVPYIVFADLAGTAMDAVMRQHGPRPVAEVLQRARQLADAIDCAASAGVYHGMLAPGDVILDAERTGVTGVGLAQALIRAGIPAEAGSPYGSPQRMAGAPPTRSDDIYSLAAITLELLIGTPRDPDQETRALREAQGLPERRRMPRPAPHETRVFTTIGGVDAGKLRAAFAAAFCEEPSERPSTAADFVARFEDAISNKRVTDEPTPTVVAVPSVSDEPEDAPPASTPEAPSAPAPVLETKQAEEAATVDPPVPQERAVGGGRAARRRRARERRREKLAASQPLVQESHEPEPSERKPELPVIRLEPIVDEALLAEVPLPPPTRRSVSVNEASYGTPVQSGSRALLVAVAVAFSFGAGFGGGFIVGQQRSSPSTEATNVGQPEPVAEPQPTRTAVADPEPIAPPTQTVAPAEPAAAPAAAPAVAAGRLLVRSTPAGADVVIDGQSRGVTPLALKQLALGAHTIEVSHPDHQTRKQRVTLSERRPERSIDVRLRPTSVPAHAKAAMNSTGSLQVASRPSGAQVFVDDNLIGTTPLLLSDVAAGSRRVRVELSGYQIWTTSVQIKAGARVRASASLEP